jgi:hypothetical protein
VPAKAIWMELWRPLRAGLQSCCSEKLVSPSCL